MPIEQLTTDRKPVSSYAATKVGENAGTVIDIKGLRTYLFTRSGIVKAVDDVSFSLRRGETLAVVGESGCGKSMTALSIMRLVPNPPGRIVDGRVVLEGRDLVPLNENEMRDIRGNQISTALDVTIQAQILDLILELQSQLGTAVILITHNLGVVAETAQRVIVMYAGRKVEEAEVDALFEEPLHPYTHGLLASIPRLAVIGGRPANGGERLREITRGRGVDTIVDPVAGPSIPDNIALLAPCGMLVLYGAPLRSPI